MKETGGSSSSGLKRDRENADAGWSDLAVEIKRRVREKNEKPVEVQMPDVREGGEKGDLDMEIELMEEYMEVACEGEDLIDGGTEEQEEQEGAGFVDVKTGEILDAVKVKAAPDEELKELERRVYVTADVKE